MSLFTNDTGEIRELTDGTDLTVDGAYLTVNVPEFEVYAPLIIR